MIKEKKESLGLKRFSQDIHKLRNINEEQIAQLKDPEYQDLLLLAKKIMEIDISFDSKAKEQLKKKLLSIIEQNKQQQINQHQPQQGTPQELTDTELDYVAGGLKNDHENTVKDKL